MGRDTIWMAQPISSKKISIHSNGSSYPFKKVSIHLNGLSYPFKNLTSVWMARVIHSKKFVSHSNSSSCPIRNICQPFQLSVGKNKIVTSSFHWKVKCCVNLPYKERLERFNDFFVFLKCSLVSFWLRDCKYPFLASRRKSCFNLVSYVTEVY